MLADDQGNRITYGEFEKIYEERSKFLEEGRLAFLYCRNTAVFFIHRMIIFRASNGPRAFKDTDRDL